jgi:hypothetical protein
LRMSAAAPSATAAMMATPTSMPAGPLQNCVAGMSVDT